MKKQNIFLVSTLAIAIVLASSCGSADGEFTGREYMPDMAHSVAYEANYNTYYSLNHYDEEAYTKLAQPRQPVANTIARGYVGVASGNGETTAATMEGLPMNGAVPYYYDDTEDERTRAMAEITSNAFSLTEAGLEEGKELYNIYCGICHGEKADGNGYLVRDDGGKYPAQPTDLISDDLKASSEGRFYHAIMYGKNVMGSYKDKLSYEERWNVIHYIRSLQDANYTASLNDAPVEETAPAEEASSEEENGDDHSEEDAH